MSEQFFGQRKGWLKIFFVEIFAICEKKKFWIKIDKKSRHNCVESKNLLHWLTRTNLTQNAAFSAIHDYPWQHDSSDFPSHPEAASAWQFLVPSWLSHRRPSWVWQPTPQLYSGANSKNHQTQLICLGKLNLFHLKFQLKILM